MNSVEKLLTQITLKKIDYGQKFQSQKLTTANSVEKQPSKLGILILFVVTIALSAFSINEFNQTVTDIIEAEFQETVEH